MITRRTFLRALLGSAAGVALAPVVEPVERVRRFWFAPVGGWATRAGAEHEQRMRHVDEMVRAGHMFGVGDDYRAWLRSNGRAHPLDEMRAAAYAEPVRLISEHGATYRDSSLAYSLGNEPPRTLAGRMQLAEELHKLGLIEPDDLDRALSASAPALPEPVSGSQAAIFDAYERGPRAFRWGRYDAELGAVVYCDPNDLRTPEQWAEANVSSETYERWRRG